MSTVPYRRKISAKFDIKQYFNSNSTAKIAISIESYLFILFQFRRTSSNFNAPKKSSGKNIGLKMCVFIYIIAVFVVSNFMRLE